MLAFVTIEYMHPVGVGVALALSSSPALAYSSVVSTPLYMLLSMAYWSPLRSRMAINIFPTSSNSMSLMIGSAISRSLCLPEK